ncbi:MAG: addiction module protein [Gemmatimonadetes bacterium]|nr:addiction module protein [Gemmatimonadota bacterium]
MSLPQSQLEVELLALPAPERARLAHRLIVSLDAELDDDPAEVERAWETEIRRRVSEVDDGTGDLIPGEQVFAEVRPRPQGDCPRDC